MKSLTHTILILILFFTTTSAISGERTKIKIVDHDSSGSNHRLVITTYGTSKRTDVLIFVEFIDASRLSMISDKDGAPYLAERKSDDEWIADFFVPQSPKAIYAIATNRTEYSTWSKSKDLSALKRLGIEKRGSINGVLSLLDEFGWIPTGYTFVGLSQLRDKGDLSTPSQENTSNICQTDSGSCPLIEYASHGEKCFCNTPSGPVHGVIAPKP